MNLAPASRAVAFANIVFPHPGGPWSKTPLGAVVNCDPANSALCWMGKMTVSRSSWMTLSKPAMSAHEVVIAPGSTCKCKYSKVKTTYCEAYVFYLTNWAERFVILSTYLLCFDLASGWEVGTNIREILGRILTKLLAMIISYLVSLISCVIPRLLSNRLAFSWAWSCCFLVGSTASISHFRVK